VRLDNGGTIWLGRGARAVFHRDRMVLEHGGANLQGLAALLGAGLSYWWASVNSAGLLLAVVCLALSGYMSPVIAIGLLIVYFMLSIEVYLATYTIGTFHLSFWSFSPTELRIMPIAGNLALWWRPMASLFGYSWRLFDVGGAIGICGMALMLVNGADARNGGYPRYHVPLPRRASAAELTVLAPSGVLNRVGD
jgi:hypothetical protein